MGHVCVSAALRFSQLLWVSKAINAMHCIYRSTSFFVLAILFLSHHTNTNTQHLFSLQALFYVQAPWDNLLPTGWMEGIWAVSFFTFSMTGEFVAFTVIGKNVFVLLLCIAIWEERKMTGNATNFAIQIFVGKNCSLKNNKTKQHFKKWPEIRQMLSVDIWLSKWEDPLLWAPVVACLISTEQLRNSQSNWKTIVTCSILTEQLRYLGAAEKCMVPKKHLP